MQATLTPLQRWTLRLHAVLEEAAGEMSEREWEALLATAAALVRRLDTERPRKAEAA